MTTQSQLVNPAQVLEIRNQGLAVFTSIQLNQTPSIRLDEKNRVVFAFETDLDFEQLNLQYQVSLFRRAHELHNTFSVVRKTLLRTLNKD